MNIEPRKNEISILMYLKVLVADLINKKDKVDYGMSKNKVSPFKGTL